MHGQTGRFFLCARCQAQVLVCSPCDRGQRYCATGYADITRLNLQREAGKRYQQGRAGRHKHASRMHQWRKRRAAAAKIVTHHRSQDTPADAVLADNESPPAIPPDSQSQPPCRRVERSIRYFRDNFFAARVYTDVDDLNAQAKAWTDGPAFGRPWPEGEQLTVRQAFEAEAASLMSLPMDAYPVDARVEVQVAKTPYVRFDLNDYSIPHTHVRRTVTVLANAKRVRVLDGVTVLAEHARSYDKGEQVEIAAHVDALIERKRGASQHRGISQLTQAIPAMAYFLARAETKGHHLASMTRVLGQMLDHYGVSAMQEALVEALRRDVPHYNAVRLALERARQERRDSPLVVPQLSERAQRMDVTVKPHRLDTYDELQAHAHQANEPSDGRSTEADEDTQ